MQDLIQKIEDEGGWEVLDTGYPKGFITNLPAIVLAEIQSDKYEVLDGSHRIEAFNRKGLDTIPHCVILSNTETSIDQNFFICAILNRKDRQEDYQSEVLPSVGYSSTSKVFFYVVTNSPPLRIQNSIIIFFRFTNHSFWHSDYLKHRI